MATAVATKTGKVVQIIGPVVDIEFEGGILPAIYNAVRSWTEKDRWIGSKLVETAICLALLGFVWFVFTWNMLHLSLKY